MTACLTPSTSPIADGRLHVERLPAYGAARAEVVLLPGWSADSEVWRPLLKDLRQLAHVTLLDLPGCGSSEPGSWEREDILDTVLAVAPQQAIYVGWSLGGNIALALGRIAPQRVTGVLCLGSNPCFVAHEGWPEAMQPGQFQQFSSLVRRRGSDSLSRFDSLQCGGADERQSLRWCRQWRARVAVPQNLQESLALLAELDVAADLPRIEPPVRHLLAADDQLVPVAVADRIRRVAPAQEVRVIEGCNHLLPVFAGNDVLIELEALLLQLRLQPAESPEKHREKQDVARSFSRAAATYDSVADLQRRVGHALLGRWQEKEDYRRVLDLGCGTGAFRDALQSRRPDTEYIGLDLAEGMVRFARAGCDSGLDAWLVADAEDLPLASHSVDLVFSSLAIQWSEQLRQLFAEVRRVLRPGGRLLFSSLGPGTLHELRAAWMTVDSRSHVNDFQAAEEVARALELGGFAQYELQREDLVLRYESALDLLRELKALGAHNVNEGRSQGLTTRARLQGMSRAYEAYRAGDGLLPASYEVLYGSAVKIDD